MKGGELKGRERKGRRQEALRPLHLSVYLMMLIYDSAGLLSASRFAISAATFCSSYICMAFSSP